MSAATAVTRRTPLWRDPGTWATLLLLVSFVLMLREPVASWFEGSKKYDRDVLNEWIREARVTQNKTLTELLEEYLTLAQTYRAALRQAEAKHPEKSNDGDDLVSQDPSILEPQRKYLQAESEINAYLEALLDPVSKMYKTQLPLFPVIYRLEISFDKELDLPDIIWDSEQPRQKKQVATLDPPIKLSIPVKEGGREVVHDVSVQMLYNLRVYSSHEYQKQRDSARLLQMGSLVTVFLALLLLWYYLRERERQRQRQLAEQRVNEAERLRLHEELRRQEAEHQREEAERANLELKSSLWANIGILAGSYAHNIKNLLVRPNDLLARCLEGDGLPPVKENMLHEVRHTLGTVTERLQQILQTVRRDPTQAERVRIDLNALADEMRRTWEDLAREKWKLTLRADLTDEPLWIEGDRSHLQQAVENLLFNSRDATFEMRNALREQARRPGVRSQEPGASLTTEQDRRQALIAAASWTGAVKLRTYREGDRAVLEVSDNGIGMTEEVRLRCTETHFTTKRHNALYAGFNAGMGLGLSFIRMILEHHGARLIIESEPNRGATFRMSFPLAQESGLAEIPTQR